MKLKFNFFSAALLVASACGLAMTCLPASAQLKLPKSEAAPTPSAEAPATPMDPAILAKQDAARERAESWLGLLDAGKFAESWQETSSLFRDRVPKEKWLEQLPSARMPFGKLKERHLQGFTYKTKLPGVPEGEYVTLVFASSFDVKSEAAETVTMVKDDDSVWRATGYFIR